MIFDLNKEESEKLMEWYDGHDCPIHFGDITGSRFYFIVIPDGRGYQVDAVCHCGNRIKL